MPPLTLAISVLELYLYLTAQKEVGPPTFLYFAELCQPKEINAPSVFI